MKSELWTGAWSRDRVRPLAVAMPIVSVDLSGSEALALLPSQHLRSRSVVDLMKVRIAEMGNVLASRGPARPAATLTPPLGFRA